MKKSLIILVAAIAALVSCSKAEINTPVENNSLKFDINVNIENAFGAQTKATKTAWEDGDQIYLFFKGATAGYAVLSYDGSSWETTLNGITDSEIANAKAKDKTFSAIYAPFDGEPTKGSDTFVFSGDSYYSSAVNVAYTVVDNVVTADLTMAIENFVQIYVEGTSEDATLSCNQLSTVSAITFTSSSKLTTINTTASTAPATAHEIGRGNAFYFVVKDAAKGVAADYKFTLKDEDKTYTYTAEGKTIAGTERIAIALPDEDEWEEATDDVTPIVGTYTYISDEGTEYEWENTMTVVEADSPSEYGDYIVEGLGIEDGSQWWAYYDESEQKLIIEGCNVGYEDDYETYGSSINDLYGWYNKNNNWLFGYFCTTDDTYETDNDILWFAVDPTTKRLTRFGDDCQWAVDVYEWDLSVEGSKPSYQFTYMEVTAGTALTDLGPEVASSASNTVAKSRKASTRSLSNKNKASLNRNPGWSVRIR